MSKFDQIKALFPVDIEVDQRILDTANRNNTAHCVGAVVLREYLESKGITLDGEDRIGWGTVSGLVDIKSENIILTVESSDNMMILQTPKTVRLTAEFSVVRKPD